MVESFPSQKAGSVWYSVLVRITNPKTGQSMEEDTLTRGHSEEDAIVRAKNDCSAGPDEEIEILNVQCFDE